MERHTGIPDVIPRISIDGAGGSRIKSRGGRPVSASRLPQRRRRIRLELTDDEGGKITLTYEGRITREKILQLADFVELYGGGEEAERSSPLENKIMKLARVIERSFPFTAFTSKEALDAYASEYREAITLSTVSTYLSRLAEKGFLERVGGSGVVRYRLMRERAEELEGA